VWEFMHICDEVGNAAFISTKMISFEGSEDVAPASRFYGCLQQHLSPPTPPPSRQVSSAIPSRYVMPPTPPSSRQVSLTFTKATEDAKATEATPTTSCISFHHYVSFIEESLHKPSQSDGFALSKVDSDFVTSLLEGQIPELENLRYILPTFRGNIAI
jgi:hypothetical protein